jgi:hypothetical protein
MASTEVDGRRREKAQHGRTYDVSLAPKLLG